VDHHPRQPLGHIGAVPSHGLAVGLQGEQLHRARPHRPHQQARLVAQAQGLDGEGVGAQLLGNLIGGVITLGDHVAPRAAAVRQDLVGVLAGKHGGGAAAVHVEPGQGVVLAHRQIAPVAHAPGGLGQQHGARERSHGDAGSGQIVAAVQVQHGDEGALVGQVVVGVGDIQVLAVTVHGGTDGVVNAHKIRGFAKVFAVTGGGCHGKQEHKHQSPRHGVPPKVGQV
jgi:hypothetical protein